MVKEVKRGSSLWLKTKSPDSQDFAWQNGYGIFSIGFSQIKSVRDYIAGQEEHHHKVSFQDEFRQLLRRYEIAFDERYVWDWFNPFRVDEFDLLFPKVVSFLALFLLWRHRQSFIGLVIENGIKREMPKFGEKLTDTDVQALIAFVRSLKDTWRCKIRRTGGTKARQDAWLFWVTPRLRLEARVGIGRLPRLH
jgi:hypothetical protein